MLGLDMTVEIYAGLDARDRMLFKAGITTDNPQEIIVHTCNMLNLDYADVLSRKRDKALVTARMIAIGLTCKCNLYTLKEIGKVFNRDHSTIIYNRDTFNDLVEIKDRYFTGKLNKVLIKNNELL